MSRVEELTSITEAIASSFDHRMAGLDAMKRGVAEEMQAARDRLRATAEDRAEMAAGLRRKMAMDRQAVQSQVGAMMADFHHARAEMAAQQRESLASDAAQRRAEVVREMAEARSVRDDMGTSTRARLQGDRAQRRSSISELLESLHQARVEMGSSQAEDLAADRERRAQDVRQFLSETRDDLQAAATSLRESLSSDRVDRQFSVGDMLAGLHSDRAEMARDQARELARHRAELQAEVSGAIAGFQVSRSELRANLEEFGRRWGEFAVLMRSKRASPGPTEEVEEQPARAEPFEPEGGDVSPPAGEETVSTPAPPIEIAEDPGRLAGEVFQVVQRSPEGIKLADLENQFSVSRIEMAQILKHLMDEGRVRKEDKLYFAT